MKSARYSNLLIHLQQCTELINGDVNEMREFLSIKERNAVIKILEIFQETMDNVGNVDKFIDRLVETPKDYKPIWE